MFEFGAGVMYLRATSAGKYSCYSRWKEGVWLGIREESGENRIGARDGVLQARRVSWRELEEERWSKALLNQFPGFPWQPGPGRAGDEIQVRAGAPEIWRVYAPPQLAQEGPSRRNVTTTKDMIAKHGFAIRWSACQAVNRGVAKQRINYVGQVIPICSVRMKELPIH